MSPIPWMLVEEYSDAVAAHGPDSPETERLRKKYEKTEGFAAFADGRDELHRVVAEHGGAVRAVAGKRAKNASLVPLGCEK